MSKEELIIALLQSRCSFVEFCKSKSNNAKIEKTKTDFEN